MESQALLEQFNDLATDELRIEAADLLGPLVQGEAQYIGEVVSLGYETALVQIHDHYRQKVGGIPSLSFLVATRIQAESAFDFSEEDSSVILLRVMDAATLPNDAEALRVRVETAQQVSGKDGINWDDPSIMDPWTSNLLSFAGITCRVIGTFYLDLANVGDRPHLALKFGSDISNYYPNRGLKVYKPTGDALSRIVNYRDPDDAERVGSSLVSIGTIRYASTNRSFQSVGDVSVSVSPADLLGQKSALFGMTRTGKSNTTKIMLQAVHSLRHGNGLTVGQLVFDPNGEYANTNIQDRTSIRRVITELYPEDDACVVTYGLDAHPNDPERNMIRVNFYGAETLAIGKSLIDGLLLDEKTQFVRNFCNVSLEPPESTTDSERIRYSRQVLVYRALLFRAGYDLPDSLTPRVTGLFSKDLRDAMRKADGDNTAAFTSAASNLDSATTGQSWADLGAALETLNRFLRRDEYKTFAEKYRKNSSTGNDWADEDLRALLAMFGQANGAARVARARDYHDASVSDDYAETIFNHLTEGRLVIVDQSSGNLEINRQAADRIVSRVFFGAQALFRKGATPPNILVFAEEAHNLLPEGSDKDLANIWVRTAKEGAKYNIGMVYATQEVSSIQRNILKNTANWFIGHLNNTDETRELCKYYDFADFESSIRRAQDKGFLRVKTLSNKFVVPVQVSKFSVEG